MFRFEVLIYDLNVFLSLLLLNMIYYMGFLCITKLVTFTTIIIIFLNFNLVKTYCVNNT